MPPIDTNNDSTQTEGPTDDISYFQEDGLEGTFVINLGGDFEIITSGASDEITDPKELEELEKQNVGPQQEGTLESDEEGDEDDADPMMKGAMKRKISKNDYCISVCATVS